MTKLSLAILTSLLSLLLITSCFCPHPCCPYRPCPPTPCCDMKPSACPLSHCCAKPSSPQVNGSLQTPCQQGNCQQPSCQQESSQQSSCQQGNCQQNSCQQKDCNHCNHCYHYRDCPHDPNYHDLD